MNEVDLIVYNAGQLVTCASPGGPKRGQAMKDIGLIEDGAVAIDGSRIVAVGPADYLRGKYRPNEQIDAKGCVVCPGFVDPHTHLVYAGNRIDEFEQRVGGASYMEIMAAGGGILSTVTQTRHASLDQLVTESSPRLAAMLRQGTTTAEIKTGYGLDTTNELKMLQAIDRLAVEEVMDIVPTFLGAHAIPAGYKDREERFTDLVIEEMLSQAAEWYKNASLTRNGTPFFNDVFCEQNAFSLDQSRRVLEAGLEFGLRPKIHAGEFTALGGASLAAELGATSADHLDVMTEQEVADLAASETVGVLLPAVNFNLGSKTFADGRGLIDAGVVIALATDINPGSAPCPSMPLVMAIATRYLGLLPAEALNAATINAAHAVGMAHKVGSLEPGKQADLLILDATDYRQLSYQFGQSLVATVIKSGRVQP